MTIKSYAIVADTEDDTYLQVLLDDGSAHRFWLSDLELVRLIKHCATRLKERAP